MVEQLRAKMKADKQRRANDGSSAVNPIVGAVAWLPEKPALPLEGP